MKIVALTVFCVDIYPESKSRFIGGNSLNFATQCVLSGCERVSVVGAVGNDGYARQITEHLDQYGIDREHLYMVPGKTASNKIYLDERGDRYFQEDSWDGGVYQTFRLDCKDWEFVNKQDVAAIPYGDPNFKELLKNRKDRLKIVVDFLDSTAYHEILAFLPLCWLSFLSGNTQTVDFFMDYASYLPEPFIITLGAKGSIALYKGKKYEQKAFAIDKIVDTTGCGDAYQAAFACEWFGSMDLEKALLKGARAASRVLSYRGAVQPRSNPN
jgi:fructoselysine 6-kinase